jgi:hypothetical protein
MPRALRITFWIVGSITLLAGLGLWWINSELKPEPLGKRIASLLHDAQIKGGIRKVEASLDGNFNAEGVDLILVDGTTVKVTSIKGQADLFASARGTPTLNSLSVNGLYLDLSKTKTVTTTSPKTDSKSRSSLPAFHLGPFNIAGGITLTEGKLISFNTEGTGIDSAGPVNLNATITWPGLTVGAIETKPRANISLQGEFQRPFGQHGISLTELVRDIKSVKIDCRAKDEKPAGSGSMSLICQGVRNPSGHLLLSGKLNDATNQPALNFSLVEKNAELNGEIVLALDPTKFGVLSNVLPNCSTTGKVTVTANTDNAQSWQAQTDLQIKWVDLTRYSKAIRPGLESTWRVQSSVKNSPSELTVEKLTVGGNGITLNLNQPLHWKPGTDLGEVSATLSANEAELATFAPLLASTHLVPTQGRWSGEAELTLKQGDIKIKTLRTHNLIGLTLERDGQIIAQNLSGEIPLRTEEGTLVISPFRIYSSAGDLVRGDVTLKLGKNSDWSLKGKLNLGLAEIARQTGQSNLPLEKLRDTRIDAQVDLTSVQSALTLHKVEAKILRQDLELLQVKLLQPLSLSGTKPTGTLFEVTATQLPLETLGALVPGLNLSGSLNQAKLIGGFQGEGLFLKTEAAPIELSDVSLSWNKIPYLSHCDLSTRIDLTVGAQKSLFNFTEVSVQSKGKSLASGNLAVGLNEFTAALNLRGDIGALAQQPAAQAVAKLASGNYEALLNLNAAGECTADIKILEIGFKDRPTKIKAVNLNGALTPQADGFRAEAKCKIDSTGTTSGKLSLLKKTNGLQSHWQLVADFEAITGDDFLALVSQPENTQPAPTAISPTADHLPFWYGHTADIKLNIQSARVKGLVAEKLSLQLGVTENQIALTQLSGKFAEGTLSGTGKCTFQSGNAGGPYQFNAQVGLQQFNFDPIAQAYPAIKDFVQGKGDASATAQSSGINIDDLIAKVNMDANLQSKNGRIQAFGSKGSETAVSATKAGQTAKLLGGLAKLAGALSKNKNQGEKIARAGEAMTAASKLQESLSDFKYELIDVQVQRLANGTIKINRGLVQNPELTINALGQITAKAGNDFNDWPLALQATMRGKGTYAEQFKLLGFAEASTADDGFTQGPSVQFTGSLNHLENNLKESLQGAVKNIQAGGASRTSTPADTQPSNPANPTTPAVNPLELLLRN